MARINFHTLPKNEKINILQKAGSTIGLLAFAVEKDWWVVQTLMTIFEMEIGKYLVFKGGTSLSKAWNLIDRFSEDIDLAIDRQFFGYEGELSKQKISSLRKEANKYLNEIFYLELIDKFKEKGFNDIKWEIVATENSDQDPIIIILNYNNAVDVPGYIQPRIQIEIGCRSLREPYTIQSFSSIIDAEYPESDFSQIPVNIPSVNPERTFLEKIFLLHEEFQRPINKIRVDRLSRHLYDIYQLSKTKFVEIALSDKELYETIVKHRYRFTRVSGVNYNLHQPQTINFIPVSEIMEEWKADYKTMQEQMIYVESPSFEIVIEDLTKLKNTINAFDWTMESQLK
jgi:predicted nucleotidyltransferase component of viral defense system